MMLLSDSVGGADASRNGFSKRIPVKFVDKSAIASPFWETIIIDSPAMRRLLLVFFVAAPLFAQQEKPAPQKPQPAPPPIVTPSEPQKPIERPLTVLPETRSVDMRAMDRSADPEA